MRKLRGLVQNRLVEVTTRTLQGRYLLRPSSEVNRTLLGVLGRAQRLSGIGLCAYSFLSNHYHLLVLPDSTRQLSEFMGFLNGNIARKVGQLHGWSGPLWQRRYRHIVVSDEPEAQVGRLKYLLAQGVKEGLVSSPLDWPGVHCAGPLTRGYSEVTGGKWWDQTAASKARRTGRVPRPEEFLLPELVHLRPLPCWGEWEWSQRRDGAQQLVREIEQAARRRREESGKRALGKRKILLQVPHSRPEKLKNSPAPAVHAATREHYAQMREREREYEEEYREASRRLRAGEEGVVFPSGCFPPHLPYVPEARAGPL